jgi:hypothetical protein
MSIRRHFELAIVGCLILASPIARATPPAPAGPSLDDPLAEYRERFKLGMDQYKAGALANATGYWEPVYRELGNEKGYRLAYNLGVAYAELGDATRAAERLQSFLDEVDARRARAEPLGSTVAKEEADARERITGLIASKGRIRVQAGSPPVAAQVDGNEPRVAGFLLWVTPGQHTVTFSPGTPNAETRTLQVSAAEVVDIAPTPHPRPQEDSASMPNAPPNAPTQKRRPEERRRYETVHPFAPGVLIASGALAIVAAVAAVPLESHALALRQDLSSAGAREGVIAPSDRQSFDTSRTLAYTAVGAAIGLGAMTAGLMAWYALGSSKREISVPISLSPERGGASIGVRARF